jgi:NADH-quinone oxidoreductase subunit L
MIHAATMVSAGVYAVLRMFPLLTVGWDGHGAITPAMTVVALIGTFTAIFAATIALAQNDIKRVLAYSTISQLGFMIAAIGIGAYVAAAFHLVTHAFFKALLFLGSGSVIHGMEHGVLHTGNHKVDPQDMLNMGGLRKKMPITFWTFLIGGLALAGFPFVTAGFWSKDEILADAFAHEQWVVLITLSIAALMTAFYTMRQITLTFFGEPRTKEAEHAHETPWTMTLPLVILSVFAIGYGWVGIPKDFPVLGEFSSHWFKYFIIGSLLEKPEAVTFSWIPLTISLVVALGGLALGWLVYKDYKAGQPDPLQRPLGPVYTLLQNKWYFDEFYNFFVVKPVVWISEVFTSLWMDKGLIDGILHFIGKLPIWIGDFLREKFDKPFINEFIGDGTAAVFQKAGHELRYTQTGRIQTYLIASASFLIVLVAVLAYLFLA